MIFKYHPNTITTIFYNNIEAFGSVASYQNDKICFIPYYDKICFSFRTIDGKMSWDATNVNILSEPKPPRAASQPVDVLGSLRHQVQGSFGKEPGPRAMRSDLWRYPAW